MGQLNFGDFMSTVVIDIATKQRLISKQAVFNQLRPNEKEVLASLLAEKHILPGEVIVREGDPVDSVYLIVSGKADVLQSFNKKPTDMRSVATLGPEDAIGLNETGFYSISGVRTATVAAITEMTVLRLSVAAFHGFALAYPHVSEIMRKNAAKLIKAH